MAIKIFTIKYLTPQTSKFVSSELLYDKEYKLNRILEKKHDVKSKNEIFSEVMKIDASSMKKENLLATF